MKNNIVFKYGLEESTKIW